MCRSAFSGVSFVLRSLLDNTRHLAGAPVELRWAFVLKCLTSYAYFGMSLNMTLYLSEEFDFSDTHAGLIYGTVGLLSSIFGLLCGGFIDRLGVRKSLLLGGFISCVLAASGCRPAGLSRPLRRAG